MKNRMIMIGGAVLAAVVLFFVIANGKKTDHSAGTKTKSVSAQKLYDEAVNLRSSQELLKAKEVYQQIVADAPDYDKIDQVEEELGDLNLNIILSNIQVPGKTVMHEIQSGESLARIAKRYGTTIELIKRSNNLKSDTIRPGQKLRVWQGNFNMFVDKSQNILILKDGEEVVKVYHVSTGENNSTPVGTFKIDSKLENPVWFNKGIVVPPESPQNVLGSRWMGFDTMPGYGIHGTVEPDKIGQQATAGCVRMRNAEVEELYSLIPYGTSITIVD